MKHPAQVFWSGASSPLNRHADASRSTRLSNELPSLAIEHEASASGNVLFNSPRHRCVISASKHLLGLGVRFTVLHDVLAGAR
jgi:hypothetical protein